jgi:hypothetical protein
MGWATILRPGSATVMAVRGNGGSYWPFFFKVHCLWVFAGGAQVVLKCYLCELKKKALADDSVSPSSVIPLHLG